MQGCPFRCVDIELIKGQGVDRVQQQCRVAQHPVTPAHGLQDFRQANPAIVVGVDQLQGLVIEMQSRSGAGQRRPELRVQFVQMKQIIGAGQQRLIKTANA